eukprot:TRINITY_DN7134_c0_g1_i1.p1 TRINITY_DN7134_c0_g1~~TRINITY_DN7134_c0_g1_i1.p1  ORF type:complete len:216 (+),score=2.23 TRINITY_DN7134_c0_g1_i1:51-698(+)
MMERNTKRQVRGGITAGTNVLFVGGISRGSTQNDVRVVFQDLIGEVEKVRFVMDKKRRCHKGYGFVRFAKESCVQKALALAEENGGGIPAGTGRMFNVGLSDTRSMSGPNENENEMEPLSTSAPSTRQWQPYQDCDAETLYLGQQQKQPRSTESLPQTPSSFPVSPAQASCFGQDHRIEVNTNTSNEASREVSRSNSSVTCHSPRPDSPRAALAQ